VQSRSPALGFNLHNPNSHEFGFVVLRKASPTLAAESREFVRMASPLETLPLPGKQ
jgi:hypothetical protein